MPNLLQLRVFVLMVKLGKLTAVAQAMGISQPTVTFHLTKLEQVVGQPLFISNNRKANKLTDFGQSLYRYAERMMALEGDIRALIDGTIALKQGLIRMGSTHTPATYFLPAVFAAFLAQYPNIDVTLDVAPSHLLVPKLLNYDLDFCFINHFPASKSELMAFPILIDHLVMIAHPSHPAAMARTIAPGNFSEFPIIMHEQGSISRQIIDDWCQEQHVQPNIRMEVSGTETMKELVKQNLGIAIVSEMSCRADCQQGLLTMRGIPNFLHRRVIYRVQRRDVKLSGAAQAFLTVMESLAQGEMLGDEMV